MSEQTKQFYAFGPFRLDSDKRVLVREGMPVPLAPKAADTLLVLVKNAGHMVKKEELMAWVWPDAFVEEGNLNKSIFFLRKALGEWGGGRQYIETVPRRGYRFVAPVSEVTHAECAPHPHPFPRAELIGRKILHYRVLEVVGGGGMGLVYKAEDLKLGRRVALKFLPEELASDQVALQRFEREARTASCLNHPNICTIYGIEEFEGQPFLAMELLEGETLRDRLANAASRSNAIPLDQFLDIAIQVCIGLEAAHQNGIIHRDIKPANIFLTTQGQVKIVDFGLAKLVATLTEISEQAADEDISPSSHTMQLEGTSAPGDATLTRTGVAMGTAGYMSPEQIRGEKLDPRTDIFSFGLVLYEMATGRRAFSGSTAAILRDSILNDTPVSVNDINSTAPAKLQQIISKALTKDREVRYQHVSDIRDNLKQLIRPERRGHAQHYWQPVLTGMLVLLLVAATVYRTERRHSSTVPELKMRQLTANSNENYVVDAAISPSGKYLAYTDLKGLHLKLLETGEVRNVLLPTPEGIDRMVWGIGAWFPDSKGLLLNAYAEAGQRLQHLEDYDSVRRGAQGSRRWHRLVGLTRRLTRGIHNQPRANW